MVRLDMLRLERWFGFGDVYIGEGDIVDWDDG